MDKNNLIQSSADESPLLLLALYILFSFINLSASASTYGTEIAGIFLISSFAAYKQFNACRKKLIAIAALILLTTVLSTIHYFNFTHTEILWKLTARTVFWICAAILSYPYFSKIRRDYFSKILAALIALNSVALLSQFISFYCFDSVIDYSVILGGESSRSAFNNLYRPSGLTSEPAVFSGYMFGLLTLYSILDKKNIFPIGLGITAIMLSMSFWGILACVVFVFLLFLNALFTRKIIDAKKSFVTILFFIFSCCCIYLASQASQASQAIFSNKQGSNSTKINTIKSIFDDRFIFLFGYGFQGKSKSAPVFHEGLYDLTFFGANISTFGVPIGLLIGFISLYLIFIRSAFSANDKILTLTALTKLSTPVLVFFPCFILLLFIANKKITEDA